MNIGFIGSGNMARAIALGLGGPAIFSDSGSGRALALAEAVDGSAGSVATVAAQSDLIFLCHKPGQLSTIAAEVGLFEGTIVSVLAATKLVALRDAYPGATVVRVMPNLPVEFGEGVTCLASESDESDAAKALLDQLGETIEISEDEFELATAVGGCAPAFFALFAQQLVSSALARGMNEETAKQIVGQTLLGTGILLHANAMDTDGTITAVASPGGLTERALKSFEESDLPGAVNNAVATVLGDDA